MNHVSLFAQKADLVFYYIASSYFEGQGPSIAKKGYSSDRRPDRNQIVLALAITKEAIPIAHEVLEGSKNHTKTVIDAVEKLKRRLKIDKLIFVADRGMVSSENIDYIKKLEYDYIFPLLKRWFYELNEESLEYERRIADKWVIKTENSQLSALEVIEVYQNLSEIERAFRTIKSFLDLRPTYHRD